MSKIKAKKVLLEMVENGGKPMSKAMKAVGYSPAYSRNPQKLARTKVFSDLVQEFLSDDLVAQRHSELLNARLIRHYMFPRISGSKKKEDELTNDEVRTIIESVPDCRLIYIKRDNVGICAFFQAPDYGSRKDAIEMAYKIRGSYAPEQIQMVKRKYQDLSNAELFALETKLKNFLLKK